jgi:K+-transporting ATPase KdpF subunit
MPARFLYFFYIKRVSFYEIFISISLRCSHQKQSCEVKDGHRIYRRNHRVFAGDLRVCDRLRKTGRTSMNAFYIVGALAAAGLLVYLVVALLKAEDL